MAAFFEQLWESIFIAGPTPTLLIATNASFAALQVLLFVMLIATYSIHFVILSLLCGGLWWSINWFATELKAAQAKEEEAKRIREARRGGKEKGGAGDDGDGMDTGDDTEVDTEVEQTQSIKPKSSQPRAPRPETQSTVFVERPGGSETENPKQAAASVGSGGPTTASTTGATTSLAAPVDEALKRRKGMGESTGDLSTDSEWDKLSEDSEDK
ncbi:ER protein Pkr1-domain-containing protein [Alternaria rosae]|uniref:ER protein Pkr1-domain-containing protein n=1 Tax=Alternaria rosae TaxID=1187941 RepID=UPI001E8E0122|nr:ER protein Pkr1-domain-containing protein [Alternaria rosae]KAH6873054.1 ER protein Pkr1-domain-containing protein [Alternaria rosae]